MYIVKFWGGLGNQLFQYGLLKKFESLGYDVRADLTAYSERGKEKRCFQLPVLGIHIKEATIDEIKKVYCNPYSEIQKAIIKRIGKQYVYKQTELIYCDDVFQYPMGYFDGYWQSEKYFCDISGIIRKSIRFPKVDNPSLLKYQEMIECEDNSVSIHVRLGDYLDADEKYGNICTREYYFRAVNYLKNMVEKPVFFVFSNDIEMSKQLLEGIDEVVFVEGNTEDTGYYDMGLMTKCKHHIIANSSFSWWGAWLGTNNEAINIAPRKWINNERFCDIVPDSWKTV